MNQIIALFIALMSASLVYAEGNSQQILNCSQVKSDKDRLACYDNLAGSLPSLTTGDNAGAWEKRVDLSPIDDSKRVVLIARAEKAVSTRFRGERYPILVLRCSEDSTSAYVDWRTYLGIQDEIVTYRVDDERAQKKRMSISTDHEAAGHFNGANSIPFIRQLLGGQTLFMQITPYGSTPVSTTFAIAGLDDVIGELREACHW